MDLNGKTVAELNQLIADASNALYAAQNREAAEDAARRSAIGDAIAGLDGLLGAEGAAPGVDSIRAVRAFDTADTAAGRDRGQTMAENPGLALSLTFEALEMLTALTREIATVASTPKP